MDCAVIGAGVVGLAIARKLAMDGRDVVILEAEDAFGTHTSARNSEVIHAGIYYACGSLKAQLCVRGREALYPYCAAHNVNHQRIGKVIVACDESEVAALKKYKAQAEANGVNDLRMLTPAELAEMEPAVRCVAGFLSPSTGIIDSHGLMLSYLGEAEDRGAMLALSSPVLGGRVESDGIVLEVGGKEPMAIKCRSVVISAGLKAPDVAQHHRHTHCDHSAVLLRHRPLLHADHGIAVQAINLPRGAARLAGRTCHHRSRRAREIRPRF